MKNFFLILMLLVSATSFAGGISGGGGGPLGSDPKETAVALQFYSLLKGIKPYLEVKNRLLEKTLFTIDNKRVRQIYTDIMNLSELQTPKLEVNYKSVQEAFSKVGPKSKILVIEPTQGDCYDPEGNPTASHYVKGSRNPIRICMSIPRLKILSMEALGDELPNLLVHELAHAAGYGEKDAILAQEYLRTFVTAECNFSVVVISDLGLVNNLSFSYGGSSTDSFSAHALKVSLQKTDIDWSLKGYPRIESSTSFVNSAEDIIGKISWSGESSFSFRYPDINGKTRAGFIKFKLNKADSRNRPEYVVTDSAISIDGKKLEFGALRIDSGCIASKKEF